MDKDKDGFITADELKQGIMETVEKKINYLVQEADVDGDGQISYYEFCLVNQINPSLKTHQTLVSAKPLDGGWGWVVVFATFMCNFVIGKYLISCSTLLLKLELTNSFSKKLNSCFRWLWIFLWGSFKSFDGKL